MMSTFAGFDGAWYLTRKGTVGLTGEPVVTQLVAQELSAAGGNGGGTAAPQHAVPGADPVQDAGLHALIGHLQTEQRRT